MARVQAYQQLTDTEGRPDTYRENRGLIAANDNFRQRTRIESIMEWAGLGLAILYSGAFYALVWYSYFG
jgi:hypothetical protein